MHGYLYNGDDLFPKQVNLCARGRSALVDLDLGPGASHELGLVGPAWDAHLTAVALHRDPGRPLQAAERPRLLYAWPVVSTAELDLLKDAFDLGLFAREGGKRWEAAKELRKGTRFDTVRQRLEPRRGAAQPEDPERALAVRWSRALMSALLERLWFSAAALPVEGTGLPEGDRQAYESLVAPFFELSEAAAPMLSRFVVALESGALKAGLLFDSRRYRSFHDRVLLGHLGPTWRHGPVSVDQLQAIIDHLGSEPAAARTQPALLRLARSEQARLRYILDGRALPALEDARRRHGEGSLRRDRLAYLEHRRSVDEARARLTAVARSAFSSQVRALLGRALAAGDDPLVAGSFYFETEHLLETTSGFTHAGIIKRLRDPEDGRAKLWMFDRVLGFYYAYPVEKLAHSVPVEVLALPRTAPRGRRYHWVRLVVPHRFLLGEGRFSGRMTLHNLFAHLKERLKACHALALVPGFYYSAMSWIAAHPENRAVLGDLWVPRIHTGFGYRTLDPGRLDSLKGLVLRLPVRLVEGAPWTADCPVRIPGAPVQP
ncbi:MAG: hypothetical protein RBU30_21920 [Polyangia bacterium]|jgi:hypothetical protein|nr:hypothetical protein [Polyangia bacterium]